MLVGGYSIAEYRWRYYDLQTDDSIDDISDEILYQYGTRHSINSGIHDMIRKLSVPILANEIIYMKFLIITMR